MMSLAWLVEVGVIGALYDRLKGNCFRQLDSGFSSSGPTLHGGTPCRPLLSLHYYASTQNPALYSRTPLTVPQWCCLLWRCFLYVRRYLKLQDITAHPVALIFTIVSTVVQPLFLPVSDAK